MRRLLRWLLRWLDAREVAADLARRRRLFPDGARVRGTGRCCMGSVANRMGTVVSAVEDAGDWRVQWDDHPDRDYICAKGMERVS